MDCCLHCKGFRTPDNLLRKIVHQLQFLFLQVELPLELVIDGQTELIHLIHRFLMVLHLM